jgi:hypothetical protein
MPGMMPGIFAACADRQLLEKRMDAILWRGKHPEA